MRLTKYFILAFGLAAVLFVLLFPPLRSSSRSYTEPQMVDQKFVAWQLDRFKWGPGVVATNANSTVARTEIDSGELLRELAFIATLAGAVCFSLQLFIQRAQLGSARMNSGTSNL
jgi:hypothetical protein